MVGSLMGVLGEFSRPAVELTAAKERNALEEGPLDEYMAKPHQIRVIGFDDEASRPEFVQQPKDRVLVEFGEGDERADRELMTEYGGRCNDLGRTLGQ